MLVFVVAHQCSLFLRTDMGGLRRALLVLERILQLAGTQVTSASAESIKASTTSKYGQALVQRASWVPTWASYPSAIEPPTTAVMEEVCSHPPFQTHGLWIMDPFSGSY